MLGAGAPGRPLIAENKDGSELDLMRGIKDLLDPPGLMNPGKVLPGAPVVTAASPGWSRARSAGTAA
ncbi:FAD-linked oxidase C-terminal domain-containing protein [Blastococcus haudaquaticus]|uniref:FAD-linked oxidase C-terminal domain-containing protein n=1 Tax=Blastococcus haudaquaticus TaxID=1938745 RepID=UPI000BE2811E|nr:FAD-linked oxidase C-terminal domain-containing protein [Blastococcus haudaquaticus]